MHEQWGCLKVLYLWCRKSSLSYEVDYTYDPVLPMRVVQTSRALKCTVTESGHMRSFFKGDISDIHVHLHYWKDGVSQRMRL